MNNKLFVIFILIKVSIATESSVTESADQLASGILIAKQTTSFTCPENTLGSFCANDCKTLLTCTRVTNVPAEIRTCVDVLSSRPFCIPGASACSAEGDSTITSCLTASEFVCTDTGYFPDPTKCNQYHVCTEESSETYECPPRYVYDAANFKCKRRRYLRDCSRIKCDRSQQKYAVYPARKSYYGYCGLNGEITMFRCADIENFEFNTTKVDCEFVCKAEGVYPDYTNEQQFFECFRSRSRLVSRIQKCPNTYVFDSVLKLCIKNIATTVALAMDPQDTIDRNTSNMAEEIGSYGNTTTINNTNEEADVTVPENTDQSPNITGDGVILYYKERPLYFVSTFQSKSDIKSVPSSVETKNSTLIDWLIH